MLKWFRSQATWNQPLHVMTRNHIKRQRKKYPKRKEYPKWRNTYKKKKRRRFRLLILAPGFLGKSWTNLFGEISLIKQWSLGTHNLNFTLFHTKTPDRKNVMNRTKMKQHKIPWIFSVKIWIPEPYTMRSVPVESRTPTAPLVSAGSFWKQIYY